MDIDNFPFETIVFKVENNDNEDWQSNANLENGPVDKDSYLEDPIDIEHVKVEFEENPTVLEDIADVPVSEIKEEVEDVKICPIEEIVFKSEEDNDENFQGENQENDYAHRDYPIDIEEVKIEETAENPAISKNITGVPETKKNVRNNIKIVLEIHTVEEHEQGPIEEQAKNDNTFKCDKCQMEFINASSLMTHSKKYKFNCDVCPKCFISRQGLWYHLKTHYGPKPFKCEICPSEFEQKSGLVEHLRTHTGDMTYSCTLCSYKTRYRGSLNRHMRVHTREKPFTCSVCPSKFREKGHLKRHMRIHSGEKRYTCDICSTKFREKSTLRQHIIIHTGEKPYTCKVCSLTFRQQNHLDRHRVIHSEEKVYTCQICSWEFRGLSLFASHINMDH